MVERIGIVGGGQLGQMLTEAARPLGFQVTVLEAAPNCPATHAGARQIDGNIKDPDAIRELAGQVDVVTWEVEHIGARTLCELEELGFNVEPSPFSLLKIMDKYRQKSELRLAGLPVAPMVDLSSLPAWKTNSELAEDAREALGGAVILKKRTDGFDGRKNHVYTGDLVVANEALGSDWGDVYAERIIDFDKELSVVLGRDIAGNIAMYPTVETVHKDSICHTVVAPADISPKVALRTEEIAHEAMKIFHGAGIFAIEMFLRGDEVMINEIAPRVHNSGHHTIEANVTSQFEQHIRAITGMRLGPVGMRAPAAAMINILGTRDEPLAREGLDRVLALPDTHPHFYGKAPRPARKVGHITVLGASREEVSERANLARRELSI
ncbi:MAG: phosphoribosylaminoimidazole carboxylase, chloroplastic [Candidatus Saccharibacteria bacterium]|nr:phosphoribosylaminoimidazole carboxylase, chloroplastic [Candidatus Saccharibacteria bacterium]